jgi:two-component system cell cycle response regulator CpdR
MAKILIAENELALREFIARGLEQRSHKVTMAQDGADALDRLKKGKFDLLLTDIDMPIMDGIALALAAGRDYPKMKIIIMSGHEHQIERAHGLNDLVYRVVSKPFTIAGICAVVDDVLAKKKSKST